MHGLTYLCRETSEGHGGREVRGVVQSLVLACLAGRSVGNTVLDLALKAKLKVSFYVCGHNGETALPPPPGAIPITQAVSKDGIRGQMI